MTEEAGEDRELEIDSSSSDHIAARMLRLECGGQEILHQETPTRCHYRSDVQEFSCYRCGVAESTVRCCCGGVE